MQGGTRQSTVIYAIGEFLALKAKWKTLSLEGIPFLGGEREAQALVLGLRSICRTLTQLRLSNCGVLAPFVLIHGIGDLSQLECLEFYGEGAPVFARDAPLLFHSLAANPRLLRLVLSGVPTYSTRITHALAGWFSDPCCCLEEFYGAPSTRWQIPIPSVDHQLLLEALKSNTSLKKVDISFSSTDNLDDLSILADVIQSNSQWNSMILRVDIHSDVEGVNAHEENTVRFSFLEAVQESSLERIYIQGLSRSQPGIWTDWFRQLQWITHLHWAGRQRLFQAENHHPSIDSTTNDTTPTAPTTIPVALWPLVLARIRQCSDPPFHSPTNALSVLN